MQNIELNDLAVYDDRYIKAKIRTYDDKVYYNFLGLNVAKDDSESECFRIIFILFENKCYLQVYLENCVYKIVQRPGIRW